MMKGAPGTKVVHCIESSSGNGYDMIQLQPLTLLATKPVGIGISALMIVSKCDFVFDAGRNGLATWLWRRTGFYCP